MDRSRIDALARSKCCHLIIDMRRSSIPIGPPRTKSEHTLSGEGSRAMCAKFILLLAYGIMSVKRSSIQMLVYLLNRIGSVLLICVLIVCIPLSFELWPWVSLRQAILQKKWDVTVLLIFLIRSI